MPHLLLAKLVASVLEALTAHTPEGGLGALAITPQSPEAKMLRWPLTCNVESVRTRPRSSTGSPESFNHSGVWLPVQTSIVDWLFGSGGSDVRWILALFMAL